MFMPPLAEVQHFVQSETVIEELPFVNQKPGVASAFVYGFDDLIERNDFVAEVRCVQAQREKCARQHTRDRNREIAQF